MTSVRPMTEDDIDTVLSMIVALHAESPVYSALRYEPRKALALVQRALGSIATGREEFAYVAVRKDEVIGVLLGFEQGYTFTAGSVAAECLFYVKPQHRTRSKAAALLRWSFENWSRERGLDGVLMGTSTGIGSDKSYTSRGYAIAQRTFLKRWT